MDNIRIGLDFGTHQTKICVQTTPDEGHGQPRYEFITFQDLDGKSQFFLPSIVQLNEDNTLSYGYVDETKRKNVGPPPTLDTSLIGIADFNISDTASSLYEKYASTSNSIEDKSVLEDMLRIRKKKLLPLHNKQRDIARQKHLAQLEEYNNHLPLFRYFKQATFSERKWNKIIGHKHLSTWYLAYILFLIEEKYDTNFAINMGVPADDNDFEQKKKLAVEILLTAFNLVEEVYDNDLDKFLSETVDGLLEKTEYVNYSDEDKDDFNINIFPEAYASLISLASRGKLSKGMSLTVDIGGGTTDISFFTIPENKPVIYRYWSIPRGLNYIAEESGFDYSEGNFSKRANTEIVEKFNRKILEFVSILTKELSSQFNTSTGIPLKFLHDALKNRIVIYNGGGSTMSFLQREISPFTDVKLIDTDMWREENVKDKVAVGVLCQLLSTAYGLSIAENDEDVKLCSLSSLFSHLIPEENENHNTLYIDKDMC